MMNFIKVKRNLLVICYAVAAANFYYLHFLSNLYSTFTPRSIFIVVYLTFIFGVISYFAVTKGIFHWFNLQNYSNKIRLLLLACSLLTGIGLVYAIPVEIPRFYSAQFLKIIATGDRNSQANGNEVWLIGIYNSNNERIANLDLIQQGEWEVIDNDKLVAHTTFPAIISYNVPKPERLIKLTFVSHPWSGIVKILWNGKRQNIDLYSTPGETKTIELSAAPIPSSALFDLSFVLSAGLTFGLIILFFVMLFVSRS